MVDWVLEYLETFRVVIVLRRPNEFNAIICDWNGLKGEEEGMSLAMCMDQEST